MQSLGPYRVQGFLGLKCTLFEGPSDSGLTLNPKPLPSPQEAPKTDAPTESPPEVVPSNRPWGDGCLNLLGGGGFLGLLTKVYGCLHGVLQVLVPCIL